MGFFAAFTLFGWDIGGLLQGKKKSSSIVSNISFLQAFKSLTTQTQESEIASEMELAPITQSIVGSIGEREILSIANHFVPENISKEIASVTSLPSTSGKQDSLVDVEELLEVPKTIAEVVMKE